MVAIYDSNGDGMNIRRDRNEINELCIFINDPEKGDEREFPFEEFAKAIKFALNFNGEIPPEAIELFQELKQLFQIVPIGFVEKRNR